MVRSYGGDSMKIKGIEALREIAPLWAEKIEKRAGFAELLKPCTINGIDLDICHYGNCIVGETSKFTVDYLADTEGAKDSRKCWRCAQFADNLYNAIDCAIKEDFEKELAKFIKHFTTVKKHKEVTE